MLLNDTISGDGPGRPVSCGFKKSMTCPTCGCQAADYGASISGDIDCTPRTDAWEYAVQNEYKALTLQNPVNLAYFL